MIDLHEYIHIGVVGKPQGVRGEVKIIIYPGMPADLGDCEELVLCGENGACRGYVLENVRWQGSNLIAKLEGVEDRDASELINGSKIWLQREDVPELAQGRYYWFEYEGLSVMTDDGIELGIVENVFATGANDVLVVVGPGGEYLIPVIDDVQMKMDKEAGKIIVTPLPGLLEINR